MKSKIQKEIIQILRGDLWHFTPLFFLVAVQVSQLSQMKTNQSLIPSLISKPIRTFLYWVTSFHFARSVHTQCKDHFSSYLFTLHKNNKVFATQKFFLKNTFDVFSPFLHNLSAQAHFRLSPFFSHIFHLFHYKSKLRMKVPNYNCHFHFWVINVIMKFSCRQWRYHWVQKFRWPA